MGQRPRVRLHLIDMLVAQQIRRHHARRVAGVDPGILDVLHHAADQDLLAVSDGVHVRLESVFEETVDQHRVLRRSAHRPPEVAPQRFLVVDDLHRAAAQHVARPHQHRITDPLRHLDRCGLARRQTIGRLLNAELTRERLEPLSVLGPIDGVDRGAEDRHA